MRKLLMTLTATTTLSAAALSFGAAQAAPIAPAGIANPAAQSTSAVQQVGWGHHRWHRWGWHRPDWRWRHHRYWGWRHRGW